MEIIVWVGLFLYVIMLHIHYKILKKDYFSMLSNYQRVKRQLQVMVYWRKYECENQLLAEYLRTNHMKKVAIYGMAEIGNCLLDNLDMNGIEVVYGIDGGIGTSWRRKLRMYDMDDDLEAVDAILITVYDPEEKIKKVLRTKTEATILYLEEIVCWK